MLPQEVRRLKLFFSIITTYICPVCSGSQQSLNQKVESIAPDRGTIDEVKHFRYLGDMLESEGEAERAVQSAISVGRFN